MVFHEELAHLERQKQLLVTASEVNRAVLIVQWQQIETQAASSWRAWQWVRRAWPMLLPGAFAGGLLLTRGKLRFPKLILKSVLGWTFLRRFKPLWQVFRFLFPRR